MIGLCLSALCFMVADEHLVGKKASVFVRRLQEKMEQQCKELKRKVGRSAGFVISDPSTLTSKAGGSDAQFRQAVQSCSKSSRSLVLAAAKSSRHTQQLYEDVPVDEEPAIASIPSDEKAHHFSQLVSIRSFRVSRTGYGVGHAPAPWWPPVCSFAIAALPTRFLFFSSKNTLVSSLCSRVSSFFSVSVFLQSMQMEERAGDRIPARIPAPMFQACVHSAVAWLSKGSVTLSGLVDELLQLDSAQEPFVASVVRLFKFYRTHPEAPVFDASTLTRPGPKRKRKRDCGISEPEGCPAAKKRKPLGESKCNVVAPSAPAAACLSPPLAPRPPAPVTSIVDLDVTLPAH
jgi:hypothetical protein